MSDLNLRTNSCIELSEIRKLDNLLTQCESSSCENICIDCCENLDSSSTETFGTAAKPKCDDDCDVGGSNALHDGGEGVDGSPCNGHYGGCGGGCGGGGGDCAGSSGICVGGGTETTLPKSNAIKVPCVVDAKSVLVIKSERLRAFEEQYFVPIDAAETICCRYCQANSTRTFAKQRFFSLDKERSEKEQSNARDTVRDGGSENTLVGKFRKHCSFKEHAGAGELKKLPLKSSEICDNCEQLIMTKTCPVTPTALSPIQKKLLSQAKSTGKDNRSAVNSMSTKSSQNSFKDMVKGRDSVNEIGATSNMAKDCSKKLAFSPQMLAKKLSIKGHHIHHHDDLALESLLGEKFENYHHDIKIPEPVEAVC